MISRHLSIVGASLCVLLAAFVTARDGLIVRIPQTRFSCSGRASGYYADMETGCQVYHMCDGLGRQFSYTCPNTTLFQQRMLVCDHWYMVNCSSSEKDYSANLLIGQRDKPFVSDEEMRQRTPRPDILSVPPRNNWYDGLKEAESMFPVHPSNSIVGVADTISSSNNNDLDSDKQQYRPPNTWTTGVNVPRPQNTNPSRQEQAEAESNHNTHTNHHSRPTPQTNQVRPNNQGQQTHNVQINHNGRPTTHSDEEHLTVAASQKPTPTFQPITQTAPTSNYPTPSSDLLPPFNPTTEATSEEFQIDARMKPADPVVKFINRFDPNSPDTKPSHDTAMTTKEIININEQLPQGPATSAEEERTPRKHKNNGNNRNNFDKDNKATTVQSRFDSVNVKPTVSADFTLATEKTETGIPTPSRDLLPPKEDYLQIPTTTVGPPIYYQWKWAVPALDLEPPKISNNTENATASVGKHKKSSGNPFSEFRRPTTEEPDLRLLTSNTEYNISSYLVPDYVFPLDKSHPGYNGDDAHTSFQVKLPKEGKTFGENPDCPQCHPAFLTPGECEPCIVRR